MLTSAIISGLGLGSMYGLIALGFHVTYVVSSTVNFSQGSAMMLGAVLGYTFAVTLGWPWPLAAAMALALCALFGLADRAHAGAPVRRARLQCLADGDGRRRHRARQRRAVHLRQGAARISVRAGDEAGRDLRRRRLSAAARDPGGGPRHRHPAANRVLAHAPRQSPAGGGAECRRRETHGHQRAPGDQRVVHDLDRARRIGRAV